LHKEEIPQQHYKNCFLEMSFQSGNYTQIFINLVLYEPLGCFAEDYSQDDRRVIKQGHPFYLLLTYSLY